MAVAPRPGTGDTLGPAHGMSHAVGGPGPILGVRSFARVSGRETDRWLRQPIRCTRLPTGRIRLNCLRDAATEAARIRAGLRTDPVGAPR
ncbi:hypothetical protein ACFS5L_17910 [Streptomyces phyllanthi]|uniref:Uncharacterized protein n=1 Tax=Streptomyces phyllanthi TaxID=1803180 RepID=A0A5N8VZD0_9ACTN|nr:hypothetical protein [Streptomyces phyllanthi]MPY40046.1 hypothetical protein [Streptomyces phyllanthi]